MNASESKRICRSTLEQLSNVNEMGKVAHHEVFAFHSGFVTRPVSYERLRPEETP